MSAVYLRPLELGDLERIHRWHNSEELYQTLLGEYRPVGIEVVREWLARKCQQNPREISLAVCRTSDSTHIGNIYLKDIDLTAGEAELHVFIGDPEKRGHGAGSAAIELVIQDAATTLALSRLYLHVLADHTVARRVYEHCGFSIEKLLPGHCLKAGKLRDVLRMSRHLDPTG